MYCRCRLVFLYEQSEQDCNRVIDNRACRESLPAKNIPMLVGPLADLDSWIQCSSQHPLQMCIRDRYFM